MKPQTSSRRQFIADMAKLASASWVAINWPQIAAAAEHAGHAAHDAASAHVALATLTAAEGVEIDAIANQIVPGGPTPGAQDAHVIYFIDNALGSFFAAQLPSFREGLKEFETAYAVRNGGGKFSAAPEAQQIAWLHQVDKTPFFTAVRRLTVLGLLAWPKYGGNYNNLGTQLIGVEERHVWAPPFGYYDQDYPGFQPYPDSPTYTA